MGIQLNIKDGETVRLARNLADQTGKSVTETIRTALQKAMVDREAEIEQRIADMRAVLGDIRQHLPSEWEGRTSKEIMDDLYDENGLPK